MRRNNPYVDRNESLQSDLLLVLPISEQLSFRFLLYDVTKQPHSYCNTSDKNQLPKAIH
jgi:hypothetical protein